MNTLIVIIYDGISNSVFQSQVIAPLLARKKTDPALEIHLISFEKDAHIKPPHVPGITFYIFKRYPFVHRWSLIPGIVRLRILLRRFDSYEMLARGPLAGYIAHHATNKNCAHIIIQARGLVAEEFRYTLGSKKLNLFERYRYAQFLNIEQSVYGFNKSRTTFQAVSPALKDYMIAAFATRPEHIMIADGDIPASISSEQKETFRRAVRTELNIDATRTVYCYSGSFKPWQCPQETVEYFKQQCNTNGQAFLLILTPDPAPFLAAVAQAALPTDAYRVCSVAQDELLSYLAAADFGLLLREEHIINFVSRPTKALEYQAAGLTVVHNDTVAYLKNLALDQTPHPERATTTFL